MHTLHLKSKKIQLLIAAFMLVAANLMIIPLVHATTYMTNATVLETNMNAGGASSVAVAFRPGAGDTSATLALNFVPTGSAWGTNGGVVAASQTVTTAGCSGYFSGSTVLPTSGTLSAAGAANVVTVSGINTAALSTSTTYCFILSGASAITTNPSAGVYPVSITDGTDTTTTAIDVIANDQVVVSAVVPPSFTMIYSGNTDAFTANLSATGSLPTITSGVTTTISTNANSGWFLYAEDSNAGLRSASQATTIASIAPGTNTAMNGGKIGTNAYALGVSGTSSATSAAAFLDSNGYSGGGLSNSAYNEIAYGSSAVSGATVTTKELADISATTPAAIDYTDTISLVGAGSF